MHGGGPNTRHFCCLVSEFPQLLSLQNQNPAWQDVMELVRVQLANWNRHGHHQNRFQTVCAINFVILKCPYSRLLFSQIMLKGNRNRNYNDIVRKFIISFSPGWLNLMHCYNRWYVMFIQAQLVAHRLGTREVPGSNPCKGDNFSMKISNWYNKHLTLDLLVLFHQ